MTKQLLWGICLLILFPNYMLANPSYDPDLIDDKLLEDAYAVVRESATTLRVHNQSRATLTVHKAITILDKKGEDYGSIAVYYDEFRKIVSITGQIFDKDGRMRKKIKKKDLADISLSGSSFATSTRAKVVTPSSSSMGGFPYTVEYTYTVEIQGMFSFPEWAPVRGQHISVEKASLDVIVPNEDMLLYRDFNFEDEVEIGNSSYGDGKTFHWELFDFPVNEREIMSPSFRDRLPIVYLTPKEFRIEGYNGTANSWNQLGEFFFRLNDNRQDLPESLKYKVNQLTAGIEDPAEKAKVLYDYVQENTRYVSIQLGIGGWQTFDADYVYENGYGDCKALTNYMKSMLEHLDIPAHAALVRAGEGETDIITDFPSSQFNHVILCIPFDQDTTWLECTSTSNPYNYLGDFTEDRHVLLLTEEGGYLVKTPSSSAEMNHQTRNTDVEIDKHGYAKVKVRTEASGFQQDGMRGYSEEASERQTEKFVRNRIRAGSFDLLNYKLEPVEGSEAPTYALEYEITAPNWSKASGPRLFLSPNVLERKEYVPEKDEDRTQAIKLKYNYLDKDTVVYHLPEGYGIESMADEVMEFETIFGYYKAQVKMLDPQTLIYTRELRMEKIQLPASYYEELREFYKKINKADKIQVVLSNKS